MVASAIANQALRSALAVYRQPAQARRMEQLPLPLGIADVLRIAAEGIGTAAQHAAAAGSTSHELHAAAIFYLETILFHPSASDARLLALSVPIDRARLRDHKRLILKWLHPDRNHNAWENKLFLKVEAAASRLESALENGQLIEEPRYNSRRLTRRAHRSSNAGGKRPDAGGWISRLFKRGGFKVYFVLFVLGAVSVLIYIVSGQNASISGGMG